MCITQILNVMKKIIVFALAAVVFAACGESKKSSRINALADNGYSTSNEVFITPHGKRYHHSWCRTIQGRSVISISLKSAEMRGRTPCQVCY